MPVAAVDFRDADVRQADIGIGLADSTAEGMVEMFSQTAEYALRAVVFLAENDEERWPTQRIAERTGVPPGYLAKVMQSLARAGVVKGQRGLNGGFTLSRSATGITILDVMNAVDPIQRIRRCPLELPEHAHRLCPLHRRLDKAIAAIETTFRKSTIAELMARDSFPK